jgi:hypothetical protein
MRTASLTLLLSTLLAASTWAAGATVYKWVDEKGVVHYSDQPHPNAQQLDVKSAQTYEAGSTPAASSSSSSAAPAARTGAYGTCELYRPENDEVFMNTDTVVVKLRLDPALAPGDKVAIGIDGKRQTNQPTSGTDFSVTVERGTHSVIAVIEDSAGKELCRSSPVTFHVRQPSKQAPNRANRPRF